MRKLSSTVCVALFALAGTLISCQDVSAQWAGAGWLNRASGGQLRTPQPVQNLYPFTPRPAPTSTLSGPRHRPGGNPHGRGHWPRPNFQPTPNFGNPGGKIDFNAGTQRKPRFSIKPNGALYHGKQQVGNAHRTANGWISLGPGASFIQKRDGSSRTRVRSADSFFRKN